MPPTIPSPMDLPNLQDQITAEPVPNPNPKPQNDTNSKDKHFISRILPGRMGQVAPIAFGGNIIALSVHAAHQTLPSSPRTPYHLYSVLGTFHSGTKTDRKVHLTVTPTRDTRTFATRRVIASQIQDDGTSRTCIEVTVDFHAEEPDFVKWSAQPDLPEVLNDGPTHSTRTKTPSEITTDLLSQGHLTKKTAAAYKAMFREAEHFVEMRHAYPSVSGANLMGFAPRVTTPQDHLPVPQRTTYEWIRIHPKHLQTQSSPGSPSPRSSNPSSSALTSNPFSPTSTTGAQLNMTALTFIMDQALSFLPLNHDHKGFDDSSACSTLEFALRIFVPNVDIQEWHLRERKTSSAGAGRTFSESRIWTPDGTLVCGMSQSCILRGPVVEKKKGRGVKSKI